MKTKRIVGSLLMLMMMLSCGSSKRSSSDIALKDVFGDKFYIGVAVNTNHSSGIDSTGARLIAKHFNSIVAENCMKCETIHPEEHRYDFRQSDDFVQFGQDNGMFIVGHCLIWHQQLAPWFFVDKAGKRVTPEVLKQRMKDHIYTIVGRYKGRVDAWDVVNEAIIEDGSYRKSPFYAILGEEFIPLAFQYAHEADPEAELYYNDYGMNIPGRRNTVIKLINDLKARGLRIDGVGMQGHMGMDHPNIQAFEESLLAYAATGVKVSITEWDMTALPSANTGANVSDNEAYNSSLNPYTDGLPDSVSLVWNARMKMFMDLFLKHADKIERVCAWGLTDGVSWRNDWPVRGRRDYPLLFDRDNQMKPFLKEYLQTASPKKPFRK